MKSGTSFFVGLLVGAIVTVGVLALYAKANENSQDTSSVQLFKEPGVEITYQNWEGKKCKFTGFDVFQVLPNGAALATGKDGGVPIVTNVVLLLPIKGGSYYDQQYVKIPKGNIAKQAGVYRYETKEGTQKTVPVVKFYPK